MKRRIAPRNSLRVWTAVASAPLSVRRKTVRFWKCLDHPTAPLKPAHSQTPRDKDSGQTMYADGRKFCGLCSAIRQNHRAPRGFFKATTASLCSAGFQTCCIADCQVGRTSAMVPSAGLETRDTADLSVSASLRRDRAEAGGEGGEVCATGVAASPLCVFALRTLTSPAPVRGRAPGRERRSPPPARYRRFCGTSR